MDILPRYGSPADRGSADYYYHRPRDPHYYIGCSYSSRRVSKDEMSDEQVREYNEAYDNEFDQKNWN
jgi:pyridoxine/pyridoxamine 5'-phosphate oxidase